MSLSAMGTADRADDHDRDGDEAVARASSSITTAPHRIAFRSFGARPDVVSRARPAFSPSRGPIHVAPERGNQVQPPDGTAAGVQPIQCLSATGRGLGPDGRPGIGGPGRGTLRLEVQGRRSHSLQPGPGDQDPAQGQRPRGGLDGPADERPSLDRQERLARGPGRDDPDHRPRPRENGHGRSADVRLRFRGEGALPGRPDRGSTGPHVQGPCRLRMLADDGRPKVTSTTSRFPKRPSKACERA